MYYQADVFDRQLVPAQAGQQAELTELEVMKFNTTYCIAKKEMVLTKFRPMLLTQKKHLWQINSTFGNVMSCANIIATIADTIREEG